MFKAETKKNEKFTNDFCFSDYQKLKIKICLLIILIW